MQTLASRWRASPAQSPRGKSAHVHSCAGAWAGLVGGRGSVRGSRPSDPAWAWLEWTTPTQRSPGSAPASGPLQPGAGVIPKASRRSLTPPVSAPRPCDR